MGGVLNWKNWNKCNNFGSLHKNQYTHRSYFKMIEIIKTVMSFWPNIFADISRYVNIFLM